MRRRDPMASYIRPPGMLPRTPYDDVSDVPAHERTARDHDVAGVVAEADAAAAVGRGRRRHPNGPPAATALDGRPRLPAPRRRPDAAHARAAPGRSVLLHRVWAAVARSAMGSTDRPRPGEPGVRMGRIERTAGRPGGGDRDL